MICRAQLVACLAGNDAPPGRLLRYAIAPLRSSPRRQRGQWELFACCFSVGRFTWNEGFYPTWQRLQLLGRGRFAGECDLLQWKCKCRGGLDQPTGWQEQPNSSGDARLTALDQQKRHPPSLQSRNRLSEWSPAGQPW